MKAVRFHDFGGPDVLHYETAPTPALMPGQVRVRVVSTALTAVDLAVTAGSIRFAPPLQLPHIPGADVAGIVDAVGPGVTEFVIGDRVVGCLPAAGEGAAAEYVAAWTSTLAGVHHTQPLAELAALPTAGLGAWQGLFDHGQVQSGQRVLLIGTHTPIIEYAAQLAAQVGAEVILQSDRPELWHATSALLAGTIDLAFSAASSELLHLAALMPMIHDGGMVVSATAQTSRWRQVERGIRVIEYVVRSDADQLADLVARVATGELRLAVARRTQLAKAPEAMRALDTSQDAWALVDVHSPNTAQR